MEQELNNLKYKSSKINLDFKFGQVVSLLIKNKNEIKSFLEILYSLQLSDGEEIILEQYLVNKQNCHKISKKLKDKISGLINNYNDKLFNINILDDIKFSLKRVNKTRLYELLEIFNLDKTILKKNYIEISTSEKRKILIIITILKDSKILLLDNPTYGLDEKSINNLIKILKLEKRKGKLIVVTSYNEEFILQISDRIIAIVDDELKYDGDKIKFFKNNSLLNKLHVAQPNIINFEEEVEKMKKIKLGYRDNINDLIKDIYRNAK